MNSGTGVVLTGTPLKNFFLSTVAPLREQLSKKISLNRQANSDEKLNGVARRLLPVDSPF